MNALSPVPFQLDNLSDAKDTNTMKRLLENKDSSWDVQEAGTTMRFCTAYLAMKGKGHTLTGTERMKNRPIGILVDALKQLGADITYLEKEGFPPLKINGLKNQISGNIDVPGNVSSQFISALLMIGPSLPKGLQLTLTEDIFSRPYIEMTLALMSHFGVTSDWKENIITIPPQAYVSNQYTVESDWSGASYWYAAVAIAKEADLTLHGLKESSFQGDQEIVEIMHAMGVKTTFKDNSVRLTKHNDVKTEIAIDFKKCPDLAQGVMLAAAVKGVRLKMRGLETLRIKETDRIAAMTTELAKINAELIERDGGWTLVPSLAPYDPPIIETYEDHRMAMAFGPLSLVSDLQVLDPDVVKKSYPGFWKDFEYFGTKMRAS